MPKEATAPDGRPIEPVYLIFSGEFELDVTPEEAWPAVMNYPAWQDFPIVEHLSGEPGGEGEVVLLKKQNDEYTIGPYYARTLKLEPGRKVIWKVYLDPDEDVDGIQGAADVAGTVEFRVSPTDDDRTLFSYNLIYEYLVPYSDPAELDAYREQQYKDWNDVFQTNWPKLKKLAETGVLSHG